MGNIEGKGFSLFYKKYFFLFYLGLGLLLFGTALCLLFNQQEQFMFVNRSNSPFGDLFFRFFTHVGDGTFMLLLGVLLLFKRCKYCLLTLSAFIVSGMAAQVIKRTAKVTRPGKIFAGDPSWHTLDNYHIHGNYSFPSGHTTTAFAMMALLYYFFPEQRKSPILFLLACLVGYSRIYLSQHWPLDVFVGSMLGTLVSVLMVYWFENMAWYHTSWANRGLGKMNSRVAQ